MDLNHLDVETRNGIYEVFNDYADDIERIYAYYCRLLLNDKPLLQHAKVSQDGMSEAQFTRFASDFQLTKHISLHELREIFHATVVAANKRNIYRSSVPALTIQAFVSVLYRCAIAICVGPAWDVRYPTGESKARVFLFLLDSTGKYFAGNTKRMLRQRLAIPLTQLLTEAETAASAASRIEDDTSVLGSMAQYPQELSRFGSSHGSSHERQSGAEGQRHREGQKQRSNGHGMSGQSGGGSAPQLQPPQLRALDAALGSSSVDSEAVAAPSPMRLGEMLPKGREAWGREYDEMEGADTEVMSEVNSQHFDSRWSWRQGSDNDGSGDSPPLSAAVVPQGGIPSMEVTKDVFDTANNLDLPACELLLYRLFERYCCYAERRNAGVGARLSAGKLVKLCRDSGLLLPGQAAPSAEWPITEAHVDIAHKSVIAATAKLGAAPPNAPVHLTLGYATTSHAYPHTGAFPSATIARGAAAEFDGGYGLLAAGGSGHYAENFGIEASIRQKGVGSYPESFWRDSVPVPRQLSHSMLHRSLTFPEFLHAVLLLSARVYAPWVSSKTVTAVLAKNAWLDASVSSEALEGHSNLVQQMAALFPLARHLTSSHFHPYLFQEGGQQWPGSPGYQLGLGRGVDRWISRKEPAKSRGSGLFSFGGSGRERLIPDGPYSFYSMPGQRGGEAFMVKEEEDVGLALRLLLVKHMLPLALQLGFVETLEQVMVEDEETKADGAAEADAERRGQQSNKRTASNVEPSGRVGYGGQRRNPSAGVASGEIEDDDDEAPLDMHSATSAIQAALGGIVCCGHRLLQSPSLSSPRRRSPRPGKPHAAPELGSETIWSAASRTHNADGGAMGLRTSPVNSPMPAASRPRVFAGEADSSRYGSPPLVQPYPAIPAGSSPTNFPSRPAAHHGPDASDGPGRGWEEFLQEDDRRNSPVTTAAGFPANRASPERNTPPAADQRGQPNPTGSRQGVEEESKVAAEPPSMIHPSWPSAESPSVTPLSEEDGPPSSLQPSAAVRAGKSLVRVSRSETSPKSSRNQPSNSGDSSESSPAAAEPEPWENQHDSYEDSSDDEEKMLGEKREGEEESEEESGKNRSPRRQHDGEDSRAGGFQLEEDQLLKRLSRPQPSAAGGEVGPRRGGEIPSSFVDASRSSRSSFLDALNRVAAEEFQVPPLTPEPAAAKENKQPLGYEEGSGKAPPQWLLQQQDPLNRQRLEDTIRGFARGMLQSAEQGVLPTSERSRKAEALGLAYGNEYGPEILRNRHWEASVALALRHRARALSKQRGARWRQRTYSKSRAATAQVVETTRAPLDAASIRRDLNLADPGALTAALQSREGFLRSLLSDGRPPSRFQEPRRRRGRSAPPSRRSRDASLSSANDALRETTLNGSDVNITLTVHGASDVEVTRGDDEYGSPTTIRVQSRNTSGLSTHYMSQLDL